MRDVGGAVMSAAQYAVPHYRDDRNEGVPMAAFAVLDGARERQRSEERHIEAMVALEECAADAERAYQILALLPQQSRRLSQKVVDLQYAKACFLASRSGRRARAALAELRDLSGDVA